MNFVIELVRGLLDRFVLESYSYLELSQSFHSCFWGGSELEDVDRAYVFFGSSVPLELFD